MLRNKKILILGGKGFVGKNLLSKINHKENSISIISRKYFSSNAKIILGDLTILNKKIMKSFIDYDIIFNCSGELKNIKKMEALHVKSQRKIISYLSKECLRKRKKVKWIQVSSVGIFGFNNISKNDYINEHSEKNPSNYYENSKLQSEEIIIRGSNKYLEYIILRPSTIYGKGMRSDFIQKLNYYIKKRFFFYISSKNAIFNLIHINDVSDALILCAKNNIKNQTFNLSCNYRIREIVKIICKHNKLNEPILVINEKMMRFLIKVLSKFLNLNLNDRIVNILVSKKFFESTKIKKILKFEPKMNLQEGLIEVLEK